MNGQPKKRRKIWIAAITAIVVAGGAFALRPQTNPTPVTVAGGNGKGSGPNQLNSPWAIALDGKGNLYIADVDNYRVQKWGPGATQGTTVAGGNRKGPGPNQLSFPTSVAVDGKGNLYILDGYMLDDAEIDRVQKWRPGATQGTTVLAGNDKGSGPNQLNKAGGVAVDGDGNLYTTDRGGGRVQKWKPGATRGTTVVADNGSGPDHIGIITSIAVDGDGNLYIAGVSGTRNKLYGIVQKWKPGATRGTTVVADSGSGPDLMDMPASIAVDGDGNLYIAGVSGTGNKSYVIVQKWKPGATRGITVAGSSGKRSGPNHMGIPVSIAVDGDGNLYASDVDNNRVQKWRLP